MPAIEPIVVQQTFECTQERLWNAISLPDQMRGWYFPTMTTFEAIVGFKTSFDVEFENQVFRHHWTVVESEPASKLAYDWCYEGIPGDSKVVWELSDASEGSQAVSLRLTHSVKEPFPTDNPVFSRESGLAGWQHLVNESLVEFIAANA